MRLTFYRKSTRTEAAMRVLEILFLAATTVHASEYAVFKTGFKQLVDGHEPAGAVTRLFLNGGSIEVESAAIERFEPLEWVAVQPEVNVGAAENAAFAEAKSLNTHALIEQAARKYDVPSELVHAVVAAESSYNQNAVSPKGAVGLMQLMPQTAAMYGADPKDPAQNIDAGTRYLRDLLLMYQNQHNQLRLTLAAYNAGPGKVQKYNGVPPYTETRNYVTKILRSFDQARTRKGT